MVLTVIGINHKTSTLEEREPFQISRRQLGEAVLRYKRLHRVDEVAIVATCNRIEFYRAHRSKGRHGLEVVEFYRQLGVPDPENFLEFSYRHVGAGAARHLFRVTSGMDSLLVGEHQIFGQVKDAYSAATAFGGPGKVLHKLFHQAFRAAKQVRAETALSAGAISVSGAAVDLLLQKHTEAKRALVIGANETTETIVSSLSRKNISTTIINRTEYNARKLATAYHAECLPWERMGDELKLADIIFTATGSSHPVITAQLLQESPNHKIFIADLALPRDVDPRVGEISNIHLIDLQDMKYHLEKLSERRCENLPDAQGIIENHVDQFLEWLHAQAFAGGIDAVKRELHEAANEELERFLPGFHKSEKKGLEGFSHALIKRFLKIARRNFEPDGLPPEVPLLKLDPALIEEPLPIKQTEES
ncbi:glutamyl-tRNA reductase [bacterium]|nr:glutamyl-tRNA reductase [bacterium]